MRKKLFAILMSAMMMVTFMPAMAFAVTEDDVVVWGENYATCTVNCINYDVTQYVKFNSKWDGKIIARATHPDNTSDYTEVKYRDLRSSKVTKINGSAAQHVMTYEQYVRNFYDGDLALETVPVVATLSIPTTVKANLGTANRWRSATYDTEWRLDMTAPAYDTTKMYEVQKFSLPVAYTHDTTETCDRVGVVPAWDLQVEAATVTANAQLFAVDGKTFTGNYRYDGAEHEIVMKSVPAAYTVVFKKYNKTTGVYDVVEKATFKDVATYEYVAQVYKNGVKYGNEVDLKTVVRKASIDATIDDNYVYEGTTINAWDYVELAAADKAYTSAAKAAKADEAAIKAALATRFDITVKKTSEAKLSVVNFLNVVEQYNLTVTDKWATMTTAEKAAYTKATANWNLNEDAFDDEVGTVYVVEGKANELDFLGNASMTKTVHVKNAKAVKKAEVRHIKAEALSGAVTFKKLSGSSKIAVAADGTMTIKKGLKKGTYKVEVKATAAAANGYKKITAKATYTVKVVK